MRASRLLSLLMLLQARGRMTAQQLADELEVSVRTIYRDMDSLSAAGVPVYADRGPDGGYQLVDGYRTRLTGLTTEEATALPLAGLPGLAAELGLSGPLAAAELKLLAAMPPELSANAGRLRERFHVDVPGWMSDPEDVPYLSDVADAVWNKTRLEIRYQRWKQPREVDRTLDPLGLVNKAGRWYLIARHPASDPAEAIRVYRVSRILGLTIGEESFERPENFDLAGFWRDYYTRYRDGLYPETASVRLSPEGRRRAQVLFPAAMAQAAADATPGPDGWATAVMPVESVRHALVEFLRLGADLEILEPPELREMITEVVRGLAKLYAP